MNIFNLLPVLLGGDPPSGDPPSGDPPAGDPPDPTKLPVMPQWAGNLPDEITATESNRNILMQHKDGDAMIEVPTGLVKSYMDSKRAVSGMVNIPGENATAEQTASFNKKMGVPDDAKGYGLKVPDGSPEGMFSDDTMNAFRADAHELGVPKTTAEELFSRFAGRQIEGYNDIMAGNQQTVTERLDGLKTELGNDYTKTVEVADKAVHYADPEMIAVFEKAGLIGHPSIIKGFAKIGNAMGEGVLKGIGPAAPATALTKQEVETMIADPKYKLPQGNPIGDAWRAKVQAGFEALYPGTGSADTGPSSGRALHGA